MNAGVHHYTFRAEMLSDISLLRRLLPGATIEVQEIGGLGDVEVTIQTTASAEELSDILALVPDGHVMVETLAPAQAYTGKRTFVPFIRRGN